MYETVINELEKYLQDKIAVRCIRSLVYQDVLTELGNLVKQERQEERVVIQCDRCLKTIDPDSDYGHCDECEHELCPDCAQWVGDICSACDHMLGVKTAEDYEAYCEEQERADEETSLCKDCHWFNNGNPLSTAVPFVCGRPVQAQPFDKRDCFKKRLFKDPVEIT